MEPVDQLPACPRLQDTLGDDEDDDYVMASSTISHGVKTLGVVGAGQMGLGIAYVAALRAQIPSVLLCDASPAALDKGVSFFETLLKKDVSKGKIQQADADAARARLVIVSKLEHFAAGSASKRSGGSGDGAAADMVIEAATENLSIKQKIFGTLASSLPLETILATNTSSISVSKIAASAVPADCKPGSEAAWKSPARVSLHASLYQLRTSLTPRFLTQCRLWVSTSSIPYR